MSGEFEKGELRQERSFRQNRRRNDSDERPQSLISYDSRTSHSKVVVPPVLARARGSFPSEQYAMERSALDDLVQCPICLDRLSQPKMLPCQHTFCSACLVDEFNNETKNKSVLKCQLCGLKHEIRDFNSLPDNLYIVSLLRIVSEKGVAASGSLMIPDLQRRCVKCQTVCETVNEQRNGKCCRHCLQTFCTICWDSHMMELNQQIKGFDNKLNSAIQKMNHKLEDGRVRHEKLAKHIITVIGTKIGELKKQQSCLLEESDSIINDAVCSHKTMIDKISTVKDTIEKCSSDPNADKVDFFMTIHKEFSEILKEIGLWGEERSSFNESTLTIEMVDKTNHDDASDETETKQEARKSIPEFLTNSLEGAEDYYKKKAFKARTLWTRCSRPTGVAIAPWTYFGNSPLLYIVGSDSKAIFVVDKNTGRYLQKITYEHMICPTGIAFSIGREEIYISDKWRHCIFVFAKNGTFLRFIGSKGDQEGYLRSPEGLAYGPNDTLFVCDTGNDRIQCLNAVNGKLIMQFGLVKSEQLLNAVNSGAGATYSDLNSPTAVVLHSGVIIVLDSGNKRVKIFNQRGEKLNEFGQSGTLKGYFKYPEVMTIDSHGFILVGDGGNCKILIFRNSGQFVTSIGTRGTAPGQFNWLSGLTITDNFEIITSDYKNHSVQIFQ